MLSIRPRTNRRLGPRGTDRDLLIGQGLEELLGEEAGRRFEFGVSLPKELVAASRGPAGGQVAVRERLVPLGEPGQLVRFRVVAARCRRDGRGGRRRPCRVRPGPAWPGPAWPGTVRS